MVRKQNTWWSALGRGQLSGALSALLVISIFHRSTGTRTVIPDKQCTGSKAKASMMASHKVRGMSRAECSEAPPGRTDQGQASSSDQVLGIRRWSLLVPSLHRLIGTSQGTLPEIQVERPVDLVPSEPKRGSKSMGFS